MLRMPPNGETARYAPRLAAIPGIGLPGLLLALIFAQKTDQLTRWQVGEGWLLKMEIAKRVIADQPPRLPMLAFVRRLHEKSTVTTLLAIQRIVLVDGD